MVDNRVFPSFNFPYSANGEVNESFVDYGSSSALNLDVDIAGNVIFQAKQPYRIQKQAWRVISRQPSTPILPPNEQCSIADETLADFERAEPRKTTTNSSKHVCNFSSDFSEVMHGTMAQLLREQLNVTPWNSCPKLTTESLSSKDFFGHDCLLCKDQWKCKPPTPKQSKILAFKENLSTALVDVPAQLLEGLLKESYEQRIEQLKFDTLQGNVLAYALRGDSQGVLVYPSGPVMEVLNVSSCNCSEEKVVIAPIQQFALNGSVKQVVCESAAQDQLLVAARGQYHCTFFQGSILDQPKLNILESVAFTSQALSVTVSPYIPAEAVVAVDTGGVYLWSLGSALQTVRRPHSVMKDCRWYECVYAGHPRCIILADSSGADLIDFRAGSSSQTTFFSIPSTHVTSFECVSSVQRHPSNTHHYFVTTDLSILLLDDRFVQHPVLKWRHHLRDPVQFTDVVCNGLPGPDDFVLLISGSQHRETHCYQYSDKEGTLPPRSTSLPWKVSPYNDWLSQMSLNDFPVSPVVQDRVTKPLIGVCAVPHSALNGFTVLQMSSVGDLFYQPYVVDHHGNHRIDKTSSGGCGSEHVRLNSEVTTTCKEWIQTVCQQAESLEFGRVHPGNFFAVDNNKVFQKMASLQNPHPACVLCIQDNQSPPNPEEDNLEEDIVCPRCAISIRYGKKLIEVQCADKVLTNKSLSVNCGVKDFSIFPHPENSKDPLSRNLLRNWINDEPSPINLSGDICPSQVGVEQHSPKAKETAETEGEPSPDINTAVTQSVHSALPENTHEEAITSPSKKIKRDKKKSGHTMGF